MDDDGSKTLSLEEFKKGVNDMGFEFDESDIVELFKRQVYLIFKYSSDCSLTQ